MDTVVPGSDGIDSGILRALEAEGANDAYSSNAWIGRAGL